MERCDEGEGESARTVPADEAVPSSANQLEVRVVEKVLRRSVVSQRQSLDTNGQLTVEAQVLLGIISSIEANDGRRVAQSLGRFRPRAVRR